MSSILKALRKVEEEKARRQEGALNLARDVLRQERRAVRSRVGIAGAAAALLTGAAAAGGILLTLGQPSESPSSAAPVLQSAPAPAMEAVGRQPVAPSGKATLPPAGETPGRHPKAAKRPEPAGKSPSLVGEGINPSPPGKAQAPTAPKATKVSTNPPTAAPPALVLTGIAYQKDPSGRMAVINDLPVMEGTVIEGARITEILPDRIRFVYAGHPFEIALEGN